MNKLHKINILFSFILFSGLLLSPIVSCSNSSAPSAEESSESLTEYTPTGDIGFDISSRKFVEKINAGWNLGNTLDATPDADGSHKGKLNTGLSTETSWEMPKTTQNIIKAVRTAGFGLIRIPVSWHNHITDKDNYTIDPKWMSRVKEIVDWAYEEGLFIIINIHHDNLLNEDAKNYPGFGLDADDAVLTEKSKAYISAVWKQIATTFKDYNSHLIFEILNEPRTRKSDYEWYISDKEKGERLNAVIKEYEEAAIKEIRATGGNNGKRFIMVPPYVAAPDTLSYYTLPKDSASDKLILSFHAYTPYRFCMYDKEQKNPVDKYDSAIENDIDYMFSMVADFCSKNNIGAICGETSAENKDNLSERIKWAKHFFSKGRESGAAAVFWDNNNHSPDKDNNGEHHGYMFREKATWDFEQMIAAAIKAAQ